MKTKLQHALIAVSLLLVSTFSFGQSINLGTAANYELFSTNGSVSNIGITQVTGNVGTNNGSSTGFGNVNGVMHDQDGSSAACAADLLIAYNQLKNAIPTCFSASLLGNGATLIPGIYSITGAATLNLGLTLDAKNDPNAVFIFQISGSFSTGAESKVHLINGALACNVYWKVEGLISLAPGTSIKGTLIANNAAIKIATRDTIEGRALSTTGAITVDGALAYTPTGCGSPTLTVPVAPNLLPLKCYTLFSSTGAVTNTGTSNILGDVGTNSGLTTGFDALLVGGKIHPIPDLSTAQAAADLLNVYNYLSVLPYDIELLYPAQFGRNLVLTPHTYYMNAAAVFTDSLYLNGLGNLDAVFVIKINGALNTSTYSKVLLINGTQAKNVYWLVEGAVSINNYSVFCGTIVSHNGAVGVINPGVVLNGKAFTTSGALNTSAMTSIMPVLCPITAVQSVSFEQMSQVLTVTPNPFNSFATINLVDATDVNKYDLTVYDVVGKTVLKASIIQATTTLNTDQLHSGIYFYKVMDHGQLIQSGKLISQQ